LSRGLENRNYDCFAVDLTVALGGLISGYGNQCTVVDRLNKSVA
jgi:hypothetical protein